MSQNLIRPFLVPTTQSPQPSPIAVCTPIQKGNVPRTVQVKVDWDLYRNIASNQAAVSMNLQQQNYASLGLDAIRSVYIDNTFSEMPAYIQFTDTLFTVVCPPYSVCCSPVFTSVADFIMYAQDFTTSTNQTTFFLSNIDRQGFVSSAQTNVEIVNVPDGDEIVIDLVDLRQVVIPNSSGTYTFSSINFGAADPTRNVVLCIIAAAQLNNLTQTMILSPNNVPNGVSPGVSAGINAVANSGFVNVFETNPGFHKTFRNSVFYIDDAMTVNVGDIECLVTNLNTPLDVVMAVFNIRYGANQAAYFSQSTNAGLNIDWTTTPPALLLSSVNETTNSVMIDMTASYSRVASPASNPALLNFNSSAFSVANGALSLDEIVSGSNAHIGAYYNFAIQKFSQTASIQVSDEGAVRTVAVFN